MCFPGNVVYKTRQLQGQDGLLEQAEHDKERKARNDGFPPQQIDLLLAEDAEARRNASQQNTDDDQRRENVERGRL